MLRGGCRERRKSSGAPEFRAERVATRIADIGSLSHSRVPTRTATAERSIASRAPAATLIASPKTAAGQATIPKRPILPLALSSRHCTRSHDSPTKMRIVTLAAAMGLAALPSALTAAVPTRDADSASSSGQITFAAADASEHQTPRLAADDDDDFARVKLTLGVMSRCPDAVLVETLFDRVLERKTSTGLGDNAPETVAGLVDLRLDYIARFAGLSFSFRESEVALF